MEILTTEQQGRNFQSLSSYRPMTGKDDIASMVQAFRHGEKWFDSLFVHDLATDEMMGRLAELSRRSLILESPHACQAGRCFHFRLLLPNLSISFSCRTRRSFAHSPASISPISSRNRVPPLASSIFPIRRPAEPENAPFSEPNSSASSRFSGMAAQLTGTNFWFLRPPMKWIRRATTSFPFPSLRSEERCCRNPSRHL